MIPLRLDEIAATLDRPAQGLDIMIREITTDSRKAGPDSLFAALPGSRVDGHDFAAEAARRGAAALLLSRPLDLDLPQIVVDDVLVALGKIASLLRDRMDPVVIGITGSNGKTTVKEMVASILRLENEVLSTRGNFNNELGLPLTLFGLEERHRYAVLEMGAGKTGDIDYLAGIAKPDVGLVNNIAPAHLEGFGSIEGVAITKGAMFAHLPPGGCAVMNADEPWLGRWQEMNTAGRTITFGTAPESDIRAEERGEKCRLVTPDDTREINLPLPGRHNMLNAAAAAAIALALGIDLDRIARGLEQVVPVPGRLNLLRTGAGWTVIDDSYNANPASIYSALQVLSRQEGESWLVLGDMKELGPDSRKMHREVGENARAMGVRRLFTTGEMTAETAEAYGEGATHHESRDELIEAVCGEIRPGVICLVKGSRSMGMEAVVSALLDRAEKEGAN